jgi:hypothetical protein
MAHAIRASLLASAIAATLAGRRASNAVAKMRAIPSNCPKSAAKAVTNAIMGTGGLCDANRDLADRNVSGLPNSDENHGG